MKSFLTLLTFSLLLTFSSLAQHAEGTEHETAHEGAAAAHEGGGHESKEPGIIWKWANFAMLAGGLGFLIGKNAPAFFRSRNEEIQKGLIDAQRAGKEAEARAAEVSRRLGNLESEIASLRTKAKEEMAHEAERVRLETEQSIAKVKSQAEQDIISAGKAAQHELKAYAADLALTLAEQRVRTRLTPETDSQLISGFLKGLN